MLVATYGPTTRWRGKTITREGDVFTLRGHRPPKELLGTLGVPPHDVGERPAGPEGKS